MPIPRILYLMAGLAMIVLSGFLLWRFGPAMLAENPRGLAVHALMSAVGMGIVGIGLVVAWLLNLDKVAKDIDDHLSSIPRR